MTLTSKVKLALLVVGLVVGVAIPYLLGAYMVSVVTLGLIFGLFAMSIDLMGGYGGLVTLGHAGIFATAAYGVGYVAARAGGGYAEQILTGLAAGLVVSVIFALMAMRTTGVYFLMVTLAQGMIVWGLSIRLSSITGAENGLRGILRPPAVSAYWKFYYLCLAVVVLCGAMMALIVRSPFGLGLRGLRESEERLRMLGYNTALYKLYAFVLAGFFATVSGILYVYYNQFISSAAAEFATSGQGVLMAILGGIGTLVGPLIGAFVIVLIENVLSVYVERWPTVMGLLFMAVILFARKGFVGGVSDAWRAWLRRSGREAEAPRGARRPQPLAGDVEAVRTEARMDGAGRAREQTKAAKESKGVPG